MALCVNEPPSHLNERKVPELRGSVNSAGWAHGHSCSLVHELHSELLTGQDACSGTRSCPRSSSSGIQPQLKLRVWIRPPSASHISCRARDLTRRSSEMSAGPNDALFAPGKWLQPPGSFPWWRGDALSLSNRSGERAASARWHQTFFQDPVSSGSCFGNLLG